MIVLAAQLVVVIHPMSDTRRHSRIREFNPSAPHILFIFLKQYLRTDDEVPRSWRTSKSIVPSLQGEECYLDFKYLCQEHETGPACKHKAQCLSTKGVLTPLRQC